MTAREVTWLRDAFNLVYYYRRSEAIRERVNSTFSYNNKPVFFYVETLIRFSPNYFRYYRETFQRELSYFSNRAVRRLWGDILPQRLWIFFEKCEADRGEFSRTLQTISSPSAAPSLYEETERRRLAEMEAAIRSRQVQNQFGQLLSEISRTRERGPEIHQKEIEILPKEPLGEEAPEEVEKLEEEVELETPEEPQEEEELVQPLQISEDAEDVSPRTQVAKQTPEAAETRPGVGLPELPRGVAPLRAGGGLLQGAAVTAGRAALMSPITWAVLGVLALIIILPILFMLFKSNSLFPPYQSVGLAAPITGGGDIIACTFFRGGDQQSGLTIGNPALALLITGISNQLAVPPAVIAGIMRVETRSTIASTDLSYLSNDYDAHFSKDDDGNPVAFGVMQFTVPTFEGTFNTNRQEMKDFFGKDSVKSTLDPQDNMAPSNILRIYSIKDSIIAATFKVRADKKSINGAGPWDEVTIKEIAARYYGRNKDGTTNYPGWDGSVQNYGNDLWKSYSECVAQSSIGVIIDATCPIPNGKISCASYGKPEGWGSYSGSCKVDSTGNGGHCNLNYINDVGICVDSNHPTIYEGQNLIRTAKSIDVANNTKPGDSVFLPDINEEKIKWKYKGAWPASNEKDKDGKFIPRFGWIRIFQSVGASKGVWIIHFVHVNKDISQGDATINIGDVVDSGKLGARILKPWIPGDNYPHVHITVGLNIKEPFSANNLQAYDQGWQFADRDLHMCTQ